MSFQSNQDQVVYRLTPRQTTAFNHLTDNNDTDLLYGGAKGGGKSYMLSLWAFHWARYLIDLLEIPVPQKDPVAVGFIGRKQSVDFEKTTLETFKRVIPPGSYIIREQKKEIVIEDTVKIFYGGLDDPKRVEKFNSAELAFCGIDQAEETERSDVDLLRASLRLKYNNRIPPYKAFFTANPGPGWLKQDFIDDRQPGHVYVPALPSDNPHLPPQYVDRLKNIFRNNQALLKAYIYGDWTAIEPLNSLITMTMINGLRDMSYHYPEIRRIVTNDPSLGGDENIAYVLENGKIIDGMVIVNERDTMKIAAHLVALANKNKTHDYDVDTIGIGKGVADGVRLLDKAAFMQEINSSDDASDKERFANKRAEMWWYAMEVINEKRIPPINDENLRSQLCAVHFKIVNGRIQIEEKDKVKTRLGRSPDNADAFVYGLWAMQYAHPVKIKDSWRDDQHTAEVGSGVTTAMAA